MSSMYALLVIAALTISAFSLAPIEDDLDWEAFQEALVEDSKAEALSLLQTRAGLAKSSVRREKAPQAAERSKELSDSSDGISSDTFAEMMQAEDAIPEAVSLVQTDAHVEQRAVAGRVAIATEADGSHVIMHDAKTKPHEGIMHMSVDADGRFQMEDGSAELSLLQKEAALLPVAALAPESNVELPEKADQSYGEILKSQDTFAEALQFENVVPEALSLVQTDAHVEQKAVPSRFAVATEADGSNTIMHDATTQPHDGIMHISVGADGRFHSEDAAPELSLLQKEATLASVTMPVSEDNVIQTQEQFRDEIQNTPSDAGISLSQKTSKLKVASRRSSVASAQPEHPKEPLKLSKRMEEPDDNVHGISPDDLTRDLASETNSPQGLSLLQMGAHVERRAMITEVDGSTTVQVGRLMKTGADMMHMSIGAHGEVHYEI